METEKFSNTEKTENQGKYQMRITPTGLQFVQTQNQAGDNQGNSSVQKPKIAPVFTTTLDLDPERAKIGSNDDEGSGLNVVQQCHG